MGSLKLDISCGETKKGFIGVDIVHNLNKLIISI